MMLKIFVDDRSFHCLKHAIPPGSRSKFILQDPARLSLLGSNTVLSCDEPEARNLLLYAAHLSGSSRFNTPSSSCGRLASGAFKKVSGSELRLTSSSDIRINSIKE